MAVEFFRSHLGVQESSLAEYSFHWIKKKQHPMVTLQHMIFSLSYSFSPVIMSGDGAGKFRLCTLFYDRVISEKYRIKNEFSMFVSSPAHSPSHPWPSGTTPHS